VFTIIFALILFSVLVIAQDKIKANDTPDDLTTLKQENNRLRQENEELRLRVENQRIQKQNEEMKKELQLSQQNDSSLNSDEQVSQPNNKTDSNQTKTKVNPTPPQSPDDTISSDTDPSPPTNSTSLDCAVINIDSASGTRVDTSTCILINKIIQIRRQNVLRGGQLTANFTNTQIMEVLAAKLARDDAAKSFFLESERTRTDKQVGSAPGNSGTTSLTVKGGMPSFIGWAIEQGAATSSINSNTVTIRANPYNLGRALYLRQGLVALKQESSKESSFNTFLKKLAVGFSFDTSRGPDPPVFIASKQQLSAVSFRYEFINHRNPLSARNKMERENFFALQTGNLNKIADAVKSFVKFESNTYNFPPLDKWQSETNAELAKIPTGLDESAYTKEVTKIIIDRLNKLPTEELAKSSEVTDALNLYTEGSMAFKKGRDEFIEDLNKKDVVTFEYTNFREPIAPDTSNFRFIWEKGIFNKTDFTFNASLTMYNKKPNISNVKRIRDFQFALGTETSLGNTFGTGDTTLTFAGRYERLNSDIVDALGVVMPNSKGDIAVGQFKLTIPIADWGIKLPLSITFANRTDLIKESRVRANFGFTFDLDPLFARFKPF
jgi:hypothetical protein